MSCHRPMSKSPGLSAGATRTAQTVATEIPYSATWPEELQPLAQFGWAMVAWADLNRSLTPDRNVWNLPKKEPWYATWHKSVTGSLCMVLVTRILLGLCHSLFGTFQRNRLTS